MNVSLSVPAKPILLACDTFKGTLPSFAVGEAAERGIREAFASLLQKNTPPHPTATTNPPHPTTAAAEEEGEQPQPQLSFVHCPMSDGGAGLIDSLTYTQTSHTPGSDLLHKFHFERVFVPASVPITGPLGVPIPPPPAAAAEDSEANNNTNHNNDDPTTTQMEKEARENNSGGGDDAHHHHHHHHHHKSDKERHTHVQINGNGVSFACNVEERIVIVEMAAASGLPLITAAERNPLRTTSYGTGELILYALQYVQQQYKQHYAALESSAAPRHPDTEKDPPTHVSPSTKGIQVFLGIGGSATNDGGLGALQALGLDLYVREEGTHGAHQEKEVKEVLLDRPFRGEDLAKLSSAKVTNKMKRLFFRRDVLSLENEKEDPHEKDTEEAAAAAEEDVFVDHLYLLCDVDNPLVGARGATYTFGPQKCCPPPRPPPRPSSGSHHSHHSHHDPVSSTASNTNTPTTTTNNNANEGAKGADNNSLDEGAVGVIHNKEQRAVLDTLEAAMHHAAVTVVRSVGPTLYLGRLQQHHQQQQQVTSLAAMEAMLLHGPGGGGAGGMSGFFHFVLKAKWVAGADAVAMLQQLKLGQNEVTALDPLSSSVAPTAAATASPNAAVHHPTALAVSTSPLKELRLFQRHRCEAKKQNEAAAEKEAATATTGHHSAAAGEEALSNKGLLYVPSCCLVTGEGSFDEQTLYCHKTVGRILEMVVETHLDRWYQAVRAAQQEEQRLLHATPTTNGSGALSGSFQRHLLCENRYRTIPEMVVLCGRCGLYPTFQDGSGGASEAEKREAQSQIHRALLDTLIPHLAQNNYNHNYQESHERNNVERQVEYLIAYFYPTLQDDTKRDIAAQAATEIVLKSMPRLHILSLLEAFPVDKAMKNTYQCIEKIVYKYFAERGNAFFFSP